jgi:hypothetical protein
MQPDFLYSVSRDFIKYCRTPMLVLPDNEPSHPLQTSIDVASLAPNAKIMLFPWKERAELKTHDQSREQFPEGAHPVARRCAKIH